MTKEIKQLLEDTHGLIVVAERLVVRGGLFLLLIIFIWKLIVGEL